MAGWSTALPHHLAFAAHLPVLILCFFPGGLPRRVALGEYREQIGARHHVLALLRHPPDYNPPQLLLDCQQSAKPQISALRRCITYGISETKDGSWPAHLVLVIFGLAGLPFVGATLTVDSQAPCGSP